MVKYLFMANGYFILGIYLADGFLIWRNMSSLFNRYWEVGVDTQISNPESSLILVTSST